MCQALRGTSGWNHDEPVVPMYGMMSSFFIQIYKSHPRSYRDLPRRYAEYGTVYRYERSGVLHGLTRVRGFTQDDAHIFCRPDQVEDEIGRALAFSLYVLRAFGLTDFRGYLSTRPDKFVGDRADWERATAALRRALAEQELPYDVDEGGGAFYGPKIDLKVRDALGREWQLSTIQFDFNLPVRFGLQYTGEDGQPHQPYMVHRALLGSMERFFGVLIEHYAGAFPVWLAPVQAVVIPISTDKHLDYAHSVADRLTAAGLRAETDEGKDRMQAKIPPGAVAKGPLHARRWRQGTGRRRGGGASARRRGPRRAAGAGLSRARPGRGGGEGVSREGRMGGELTTLYFTRNCSVRWPKSGSWRVRKGHHPSLRNCANAPCVRTCWLHCLPFS